MCVNIVIVDFLMLSPSNRDSWHRYAVISSDYVVSYGQGIQYIELIYHRNNLSFFFPPSF